MVVGVFSKMRCAMGPFWKCVWYFGATGVVAFFAGRLLPKNWFRPDWFPYRSYPFEKSGRVYNKLKIKYWQNKVPDMSKILPGMMPAKKLGRNIKQNLPRMLQETCVAEFVHTVLCFSGLYCLRLWPGVGGIIAFVLYVVLFNLPFILIQRYNRPRLMKLHEQMQKADNKTMKGADKTLCEC